MLQGKSLYISTRFGKQNGGNYSTSVVVMQYNSGMYKYKFHTC